MPAVLDAIRATLQAVDARECDVCVALSGGIDSVSLLDGLQQVAAERRLRLSALHINHGLSPAAPQWEAFCRRLCAERGIEFACVRVRVERESGLGLEAAARKARYAAFAESGADYLALAHHLDDQIETFLIQLLRGAGARGMSAMPTVSKDEVGRMKDEKGRTRAEGVESALPSSFILHPSSLSSTHPRILRPLLAVTRGQIEEYARARALKWVEDESNLDTALDRNFLRRDILPLIAARFPGYRETLARSARNLADAAALADALAEIDLQSVRDREALRVEALSALPRTRALNVLRHVFDLEGLPMPPRARLEEALRQCMQAAPDAQVRVGFGPASIRRHRGRITLVRQAEDVGDWTGAWRGEETLALPQGLGWLRFIRTSADGISQARLASAPVTVRFRRGGERFSPGPGRPRRALKSLLQEAQVPAWERGRVPLLFCGDCLAWVAGVGVAAQWQAREGEPAVRVEWHGPGAQDSAC
jgi:tRNA(Ile)-lysidine synthase